MTAESKSTEVLNDAVEFAKLDVFSRIDAIESELLKKDPQLPTHLAAIHKTLIQYEELAHLLSDDQIKILFKGQMKHMAVELIKEGAGKKTSASTNKRLSQTTVDDL